MKLCGPASGQSQLHISSDNRYLYIYVHLTTYGSFHPTLYRTSYLPVFSVLINFYIYVRMTFELLSRFRRGVNCFCRICMGYCMRYSVMFGCLKDNDGGWTVHINTISRLRYEHQTQNINIITAHYNCEVLAWCINRNNKDKIRNNVLGQNTKYFGDTEFKD